MRIPSNTIIIVGGNLKMLISCLAFYLLGFFIRESSIFPMMSWFFGRAGSDYKNNIKST